MTAFSRRGVGGYTLSLINLLKVMALVLLSYLMQVSVVPYLKVGDVMPNLLMVCIAVLTVAKGKRYAFASGAVIGILLESMASNLRMFNLLMYPALALLCSQVFADMTELKRELLRIRIAQRQADRGAGPIVNPYRRRRWRLVFRRTTADDLDPHLRTLLNALMLVLLYEAIMIAYIALEGVSPTWGHLGRMTRTLLYTAAASVLMFPARAFLNMYRFRRKPKPGDEGQEAVTITERDLRQIALEPDLPEIRGVEPMAAGQKVAEEDAEPHTEESIKEVPLEEKPPKPEADSTSAAPALEEENNHED